MDRRYFLKLCGLLLAAAPAGLAAPRAPAPAARPPGTCGGWADPAGNGRCDRSEQAQNPCRAFKCPGHAKNASRRKDAPEGACAAWKPAPGKAFCASSAQASHGCRYAICPAHRDHVAPAGAGAARKGTGRS